MITKNGHCSRPPPIGLHLSWMINVLEGQPSPRGFHDPYIGIRFTGEHFEKLLEDANHSHVAYDAARELITKFLKQGGQIPEPLLPFLTQDLLNDRKKRSRGRHPMENLHRDICIISLLSAVEKVGFIPMSRNSDPIYDNTTSLCDVMHSALTSIGFSLTYEAVISIWKKRMKLKHLLHECRISIEVEKGQKVCYIAYADTSLAIADIDIESQNCWSIRKMLLNSVV